MVKLLRGVSWLSPYLPTIKEEKTKQGRLLKRRRISAAARSMSCDLCAEQPTLIRVGSIRQIVDGRLLEKISNTLVPSTSNLSPCPFGNPSSRIHTYIPDDRKRSGIKWPRPRPAAVTMTRSFLVATV